MQKRSAMKINSREITRRRNRPMKILLAVDGSKYSDAAVRTVTQERQRDVQVRVLHVLERPPALAAREMAGYRSALAAAAQKEKIQAQGLLAKIGNELRSKGFKVSTVLEEGDPKSKILELARKWRADLIVVGSHGRKGLEHFLLGSVSEAVARYAPCAVEIVRAGRNR
jgi:nucleotide-binding universal stress UspA family protein